MKCRVPLCLRPDARIERGGVCPTHDDREGLLLVIACQAAAIDELRKHQKILAEAVYAPRSGP
jgi:hypothetical protein